MNTQTAPNRLRDRVLAAAFPLSLWFLSTYFFLGDTGRWNDDYFCTLRVPETGGIAALAFTGPLHFWRPLYRVLTPTLHTLLWRDLWALHLIGAVVHGLTSWILWRLLRLLGLSRLPAAAGSLTFLAYPAHYEPSLWPTAMPTALATAIFLGTCTLYIRWARGGLGWWFPIVLAGITFAIASLNEQPIGGMLILPLLYLAARPPGEALRRSLVRALVPAAVAGLAALAYIAGHLHYASPAPATGNGSFVPIAGEPEHLKTLAMLVGDGLDLNHFGGGALRFGWSALLASPVVLAAWAMALLGGGAAWVWFQARCGEDRERTAEPPVRPGAIVVIGLTLFVCQWLAIVPLYYWINSRLFYAPMTGAATALAGLGELLGRRLDCSPRAAAARIAVAAGLVPALAACAVMMIGIQAAYRARDRQDQRDAATLLAAIPDPAPDSTLVPLYIRGQAFSTGSANFDRAFRTPYMSWWSATNFTRFTYRRSDLHASTAEWLAPAVRGVDEGVMTTADQQQIPIALAVPFVIDDAGVLRIVTRLRVERPGHPPEIVPIPQTSEAAAAGRIPERVAVVKLGK